MANYVFALVVKPGLGSQGSFYSGGETGHNEILTFKVKFNLDGHGESPPPNIRGLNQSVLHLWSRFGGPSLNRWWVMAWTNSKLSKFGLLSWIWPWRSRSVIPQNNRNLNQGVLYLIQAWMGDELWRGQAWGWRAHTHADLCRQRQHPKAKTGPW